jgi:hypothetical protein
MAAGICVRLCAIHYKRSGLDISTHLAVTFIALPFGNMYSSMQKQAWVSHIHNTVTEFEIE